MASWFDTPEVQPNTVISPAQAALINQLMAQGLPLAEIAQRAGIPATYLQSLTGYQMNGPNNQGGAEIESPGVATVESASDPIAFIREWQQTHPASQQSFYDLAAELKARFGIDRAAGGVGPSNNEFLINGQKVKAYSEGGNSWYDPGGLTPEGEYTGGGRSLADFQVNAPTYTYQPYTPPAPFNYKPFEPGTPFTPPSAESVLSDPGVQAALQEGQRALESSASARGTLLTGRTGLDVSKKLSDYALGFYDDAFNRSLNSWQANEGQRYNDYLTDRNNAFQNYTTNAGIGFNANQLNNNNSLAAFQANLGAQNQYWNQGRLSGLDAYGQQQDYINNLFRYYSAGQGGSGIPYPYTGSYA